MILVAIGWILFLLAVYYAALAVFKWLNTTTNPEFAAKVFTFCIFLLTHNIRLTTYKLNLFDF